jgi:outer membrane protein assembly factor BamB/orotate phosphoribosyltransferase
MPSPPSRPEPDPAELERFRRELRHGLLNIALKWGEGVDRSGKPYEWMIDCRELLLQGPYLHYAARLLWERIRPYRPSFVGGLTLAANPLTIGILYESRSDATPVDTVLIRRQPKDNGLRKQVEGPPIPSGSRFALVDDLVNMGDTQRQAVAALAPSDPEIVALGVIIDYEREGARWVRDRGIAVEALFTLAELGIAARPPSEPALARLAWEFGPLNSGDYPAPKSTPRVVDDTLYVGSDAGFVVALSLEGEERWRCEVRDRSRGVHSTPAVHDGRVYFGAYDGYLYCVDAAAGALRWELRPGQWIGSSPAVHPDGRRLYVGIEYGERGGGLIAVDLERGRQEWEAKAQDYVHSSPFVDAARDQVVFGANDGAVRAVDAGSGRIRWTYETEGAVKGQPVVDDGGTCFAASMDGWLYAVDAASGSLRWRRRLSRQLYANPLLVDDLVVVGGYSGRVVALERESGDTAWVASTRGVIVGGAARIGEALAVGSVDGRVYLLEARSGTPLWEYRTEGRILGTPGVAGNSFYVPSFDGKLYAFTT